MLLLLVVSWDKKFVADSTFVITAPELEFCSCFCSSLICFLEGFSSPLGLNRVGWAPEMVSGSGVLVVEVTSPANAFGSDLITISGEAENICVDTFETVFSPFSSNFCALFLADGFV